MKQERQSLANTRTLDEPKIREYRSLSVYIYTDTVLRLQNLVEKVTLTIKLVWEMSLTCNYKA
jgi:hypothetical protein